MEEKKLRIIYSPSFVIDDPRILTSLCIFYDEVMLFNSKSVEEEMKYLEELYDNRMIDAQQIMKGKFINGPLKLLESENVIKVYTPNEVNKYFGKSNEIEVGITDVKEADGHINLIIDNLEINDFTKSIIQYINREESCKVSDLIRAINMFSVAETYKIPIFSFNENNNLGTGKNSEC